MDSSSFTENEEKILQLLKKEVANFTTENISGCVERDLVKKVYTENIDKRLRQLKDLEQVTHSGNQTPEAVTRLLKEEKNILKRSKKNEVLKKELNDIKEDLQELINSSNKEKIQQQAHRDAMAKHRKDMLNMKRDVENQYLKLHGILEKIGTKLNRKERSIYNLYGITWALEDLMSIFTSLFQLNRTGITERLRGALNGILNLTKTFMTALLDSLFSILRRVIDFFTCFEKNSIFICLIFKFGAIMMALAVTAVLMLFGYLLLSQSGILPILKAAFSFCYDNFIYYGSLIGNFILENVPFLRALWQSLVSYYTYFIAVVTEGVPLGVEFIKNCISWLGKRLAGLVTIILKWIACQMGGGYFMDCSQYDILEYLHVSARELQYIGGNFSEGFQNITNMTSTLKKEEKEKTQLKF
jgi:hypothetical protein